MPLDAPVTSATSPATEKLGSSATTCVLPHGTARRLTPPNPPSPAGLVPPLPRCGRGAFLPRSSSPSPELQERVPSAARRARVSLRVGPRNHGAISLARSRNSYFWILPVEVFGKDPNTMLRGTL